ncbi:MAG TPA: hypothetical protein IAA54_09245 [Candidatus Gallacutalibacter pullicola]|uniref:Uncharacterized protein n=1 Tax=Candidatus Gallacutalibacter pullicola TaxID=2840830 RepID=A0A9D1DRU1_9FIRM|nr:hypothetical protein [Candidatus Gallacutalibacter pullicola]
MSEHIVHTAILEDSFHIGVGLPKIPESFREVMRDFENFSRLGCITVSGDQFSFRLLEEYKPLWPRRDELLKAKLAFVLGWISHRACDREMKPIWREPKMKGRGSDVDPNLSPTECSVYHEGVMYNRYYAVDPTFRLAIFPEELACLDGIERIDLDRAALFIQQAFGASYMNIQTLSDTDGMQTFFEEMCMRAQKFYVDLRRYTRSAGSPDPELTAEYVTDINWIDNHDEIVNLAVRLRGGETPSPAEYENALAAEPASHYGKALRLSLSYILTAAEYFERDDMGIAELKERLDIGKKGPGGLAV